MKIKMKKQRKKAISSQNHEVEKQINEYKQHLSHKSSEKKKEFKESVVIYAENRSEIDFLSFSLEEKTKELEKLRENLEETHVFHENMLKDQENTTKATIIIKEEAFKHLEREILKENELIFEKMKDLQEKTIFLELKLEKTRQKKKKLKELYYESSNNEEKHEEKLKEFYINELIIQKKSQDLLEEELKGVLARNCELEEVLSELQREKEGFLKDFAIENNEKKLWKGKYEENIIKIKEINEENRGFWRVLEEYQCNMMEIVKKFCEHSQKTQKTKGFYQFPMQQCHFIEKSPETKQNCCENTYFFEEM